MALQALQAFGQVCADLRITMTICTFLKHTLSDPPLSQGTEPFSPESPSRWVQAARPRPSSRLL